MGIMSDFREERKADWSDIADAIHDSVTMENVIAMYFHNSPPETTAALARFTMAKTTTSLLQSAATSALCAA